MILFQLGEIVQSVTPRTDITKVNVFYACGPLCIAIFNDIDASLFDMAKWYTEVSIH